VSEEIAFRKGIIKREKFDELLADDPAFMLRHFDEVIKRKLSFSSPRFLGFGIENLVGRSVTFLCC